LCSVPVSSTTGKDLASTILTQLSQLGLKDRKATIVAQTLANHKLPTNRARELIKPSTHSASLRIEIEKKCFAWILGSLCVTSQ